MDDTYVKIKLRLVEEFFNHLNSQHPRIQFTTEQAVGNQLAFLDTMTTIEEDRKLSFKIYRKATHTDQYLQFDSHHHIKQKTGIIQTFRKRIESIVTKESDRTAEENHVKMALRSCGHPEWTFKKRPSNRKEQGKTRESR